MKIKKNILTLSISLAALVSCTSISKNSEDKNIKKEMELIYIHSEDVNNARRFSQDYLNSFSKEDFKIKNLDYVYEGEQLNFDTYISPEVVIEKVEAKKTSNRSKKE